MKLTENLDKNIAAFEQELGRPVSAEALPLIKAMCAAGDQFEALGVKDASSGHARRTKEAFIEWARRELIDPVGEDHPIVALMYMCYIDGYNTAKEGHYV